MDLRTNYEKSKFRHKLVRVDDYINNPKATGYRSVHLVYQYQNDKAKDYNGLLIELQIRTRAQHAWATAVETLGTFLNYALKSSLGPQQWLDFFALAGSAFAHLENTTSVPGYEDLSAKDTFKKVRYEARKLKVRDQLLAYRIVADAIDSDKVTGSYHLIILDLDEKKVQIRAFGLNNLKDANKEYGKTELLINQGRNIQAVLVSAGPIKTLKKAYPNYFLDTGEFVKYLDQISVLARNKA